MIKEAGSKFDDYSISPKIRQILIKKKKKKHFFDSIYVTRPIIYITSKFNFRKKANTFLAQF